MKKTNLKQKQSIPRSLAPAFPEYRLRDLDRYADAAIIIERALEHGTRQELRWLFQNYPTSRIRRFVRESGARHLSKRAFNYWRLVLGVRQFRLPPFQKARQVLWGR
ncbi:MAG: hypothetical protein HY327_02965 [Chloroflexi bacterium]|nr:hypothetical protein [Chloroflexota bacterium]